MSRLAGLEAGAEEFLTKPPDRTEQWGRVRNLLRLKEYNDFLDNYSHQLEDAVHRQTEALRESYIDTIITMTKAAEHKDEDTGAHLNRMSEYSRLIGEIQGLDRTFCKNIFYASRMHDIGKLGIPDAILLKPGKHTPEEFDVMKTHSTLGGQKFSPVATLQ